MSETPHDRWLFITYAYDDRDDAPVLDSSPTLEKARHWMRDRGEGWCYRYERQADGGYDNPVFIEVINAQPSEVIQ